MLRAIPAIACAAMLALAGCSSTPAPDGGSGAQGAQNAQAGQGARAGRGGRGGRGVRAPGPGEIDTSRIGAVDAAFRREGRQPTGSIFDPIDLPTPNDQRLGSGAPGPGYWQQRVDYTIDARLDTGADGGDRSVSAEMKVVYHNNSPHELDYLWLSMEQNVFRTDSIGTLQNTPGSVMKRLEAEFDGGYRVEEVATLRGGVPLTLSVYDTVARLELPEPIGPGGEFSFRMKYRFVIPPHLRRMGAEDVEQGTIYELAQWFPVLCNYDDVHGWNTKPYLGSGEFYTNYGAFDVSITVPGDQIVSATGSLTNADEVLTPTQRDRLTQALASDEPVRIVEPGEVGTPAVRPEGDATERTWRFQARNVRTFAWASSEAFVWDACGANVPDENGDRRVLVQSFYPKEATAWDIDDPSGGATRAGKHSIEFYSEFVHPYPYPVMSNINGPEGGMEYPMIVFCGSRTNGDGMIGVTDHEIGHSWFPMLVNSDERRHMWQDEGFNTFINIYSIADYKGEEPSIDRHLGQAMDVAASAHPQPIETEPDRMWPRWVGALNYRKTGLGLFLLREKILGHERFDAAFRGYVDRWAFKHPQPADFFRSMEDGAGMDLAWFWRGWFLEAATIDQAIVEVGERDHDAIVVLDNKGRMVMPVFLRVVFEDGSTMDTTLPVEVWGVTDRWQASIPTGGKPVRSVEIDPDGYLPDTDRSNNRWH